MLGSKKPPRSWNSARPPQRDGFAIGGAPSPPHRPPPLAPARLVPPPPGPWITALDPPKRRWQDLREAARAAARQRAAEAEEKRRRAAPPQGVSSWEVLLAALKDTPRSTDVAGAVGAAGALDAALRSREEASKASKAAGGAARPPPLTLSLERLEARLNAQLHSPPTPLARLKRLLRSNMHTVSALFGTWDVDGDGLVDRPEFVQAMIVMGLHVSNDEMGALFERCDPDGSGTVDLREFSRLLRESRSSCSGRAG